MRGSMGLSLAESKYDVEGFWNLFNQYIDELSVNAIYGDDFDLDYFYSDEYRDSIERLRTRNTNPLRILFIRTEESIIGFLMYVTYFDEEGKCVLMEYYIAPDYRNQGAGKSAYVTAEAYLKEEGAQYIVLTPTNEGNERFWCSLGFVKTPEMDEDNKFYYHKLL